MASDNHSSSDSPKATGMRKWSWIAFAIILWAALFSWLASLFWNRSSDVNKYFSWHIGETISYKDDGKVVFQNWGGKEVSFDYRWTVGHKAAISFRLGQVEKNRTCVLIITARSFGAQEIAFSLNDHSLGKLTFPGMEMAGSLSFNSDLLTTKAMNVLTLHIPHARQPGNGDLRLLGLALKSFIIQYSDK
jgi:hypothetical protein